MKIDSEEAKVLITSCPYIKFVKNALNVIQSDNVYDIFKKTISYMKRKKHARMHMYFFNT